MRLRFLLDPGAVLALLPDGQLGGGGGIGDGQRVRQVEAVVVLELLLLLRLAVGVVADLTGQREARRGPAVEAVRLHVQHVQRHAALGAHQDRRPAQHLNQLRAHVRTLVKPVQKTTNQRVSNG